MREQDMGASLRDRAAGPSDLSRASASSQSSIPSAKKLHYFVWSPEGLTEPRVLFATHKQAMHAAFCMAQRHPANSFYAVKTMSRPIRAEDGKDA